jgi:carbon-monoxide dehydrogenase medium subunit
MKAFDYAAPTSLQEALSLLASGEAAGARPMAGGTDVLVQMRAGRLRPDRVVDLKKVPELTALRLDGGGLTIGAAVPCYQIYGDAAIAKAYPGLIDAASIIGGIGIQGRATLGGNLCNSSPSGDSIPILIALGATANIAGPNGQRSIPVESFCTGPGRNVLDAGELLVSLTVPAARPGAGAHYQRFIPRYEMDIAVVGVGAAVDLSPDGQTIRSARVALGAVAPIPLLVAEAGAALEGKPVGDASLDAAAEAARAAARPITDMRGTAAQRRHLVGVLTKRVLQGAIARARGQEVASAHVH